MLKILEQTIGAVQAVNKEYKMFAGSSLDKESQRRLDGFTPRRILQSTVRGGINDVILGHLKKPKICLGIHESRDSIINLHSCPHVSHACLHGETTIIPAILVGSFLIKQLTGKLPFEHPGMLFREMVLYDQEAQQLYGTSSEEERLLIDGLTKDQYRARCDGISPKIAKFQTELYTNRIRPYVENFIGHIREVIGKN